MRLLPAVGSTLLLLGGCGELEGASTFTEAPGYDATPVDAAPSDTSYALGQNDLDGYYVDDIIPTTRALYRLDRASDPAHPWIVFVSTTDKTALPCELFKTSGWNARVPAGAMIHVLELGSTAAATFTVRVASPPAVDGAMVGRAYQATTALKLDKAIDGTVTVTRSDLIGTKGSFDAMFEVLYEDDPIPYKQRVRGAFDAPACAVE
jgi:hypothetical protein